jgi:hypothetical protein
MKARRLATVFAVVCALLATPSVWGYKLLFKEQLYEMNHQQLYMYPEDYAANIAWLERALSADFANPLYAFAEIENEREWEYYRSLFWVHLNLHIVDQYLGWAAGYMKFDARFFNYPWKEDNLASLERAESLFSIALYYWEEAVAWSEEAARFPWMSLEEIQYWADQSYRIATGELDYGAIIARHQERLEEVRAQFETMDANTY